MNIKQTTIHRALIDLKTIDSRIDNSLTKLQPLGLEVGGKLNSNLEEKQLKSDIEAQYQSITDLIALRKNTKAAVVKANAETIVDICGKKMTIAEAIDYKNVITLKKRMLDYLKTGYVNAKNNIDAKNEKVKNIALSLAEKALQRESVKISDSDVMSIIEPYIEKNKSELFDPLDIKKLIDNLEKEVDEFTNEVDACLSVANSLTKIDIVV